MIHVSVPQKSQKDPLSLEELYNVTLLAGLGLLHKAGWALGSKSFQIFSTFSLVQWSMHSA